MEKTVKKIIFSLITLWLFATSAIYGADPGAGAAAAAAEQQDLTQLFLDYAREGNFDAAIQMVDDGFDPRINTVGLDAATIKNVKVIQQLLTNREVLNATLRRVIARSLKEKTYGELPDGSVINKDSTEKLKQEYLQHVIDKSDKHLTVWAIEYLGANVEDEAIVINDDFKEKVNQFRTPGSTIKAAGKGN